MNIRLDTIMIKINMLGKETVTAKLVMSLREMDQVVKTKRARKRQGAGDAAGEDYYEAEVSILELEQAFFRELELPNLKRKEMDENRIEHVEFNDIRKTGLWGNIDKKRTMISAYKRNAMSGKASFHPIHQEDLKFRTWNEVLKPDSKAVVLAMMDTSGSMGIWEKYMARSFFFWMTRFYAQSMKQ